MPSAIIVVPPASLTLTETDWQGLPSNVPPAVETVIAQVPNWRALADEVRSGQRSIVGLYPWRTDVAVDSTSSSDTEPSIEDDTLMGRAFSRGASDASWGTVRPLIDACLEQGASLYAASPGRSLIGSVQDPQKLHAWLNLGGDPCALNQGSPQWWDLVSSASLPLLDVLAAHPSWPRWSRVRDVTGGTVLNHWAMAPRSPWPSMTGMLETFDWLRTHTLTEVAFPIISKRDRTSPLPAVEINHWTATLLSRALQAVETTPRSGRSVESVPATTLWRALVIERLHGEDAPWLDRAFRHWCNANRRVKKHDTLFMELQQAVEYRALSAMATEPAEPAALRRRL